MNTISHSSVAFLQRRRFFTVLPILVCPFLILFFWLLGGGSAVAADTTPTHTVGGLNLTLPAARLKDVSHLTKMDYYQQADRDSAKRLVLAKNDPYYRLPGLPGQSLALAPIRKDPGTTGPAIAKANASVSLPRLHDSDRNEALVYRKLAVLNAALSQKAPVVPPPTLPSAPAAGTSMEVTHLEDLVQSLHTRDTSIDPDLRELSQMLDKIMVIQHPPVPASAARADEAKIGPTTETPVVTLPADTVRAKSHVVADLADSATQDQNGFYEPDDSSIASPAGLAIPAVVDETLTVINGSTVPFRLLTDIRVKGALIPTGSLAYGTVQLSGDRLTVTVKSVQYHESFFVVSLAVYSPDGLPGIPAPPSVTRDVAKQSADVGIQSLGFTPLDQSLGAQATAAGLQAAKNLFSKKVRLLTVTLPAGYAVLLKDNTSH